MNGKKARKLRERAEKSRLKTSVVGLKGLALERLIYRTLKTSHKNGLVRI